MFETPLLPTPVAVNVLFVWFCVIVTLPVHIPPDSVICDGLFVFVRSVKFTVPLKFDVLLFAS